MQCHTSADKCADQDGGLPPQPEACGSSTRKNDSHAQQNTRAAYQNNDLSHLSAQSADAIIHTVISNINPCHNAFGKGAACLGKALHRIQ